MSEPRPGRRPTLSDVAARSGMSKAAVSMILNDRPGSRLSAEAAARVRAAADELGYRPNPAAQSLRLGRTGTIGFISSVTEAFCGDCNRLRLSTDGRLYTCLFAHQGHDLRAALRGGDDDATLIARLDALWAQREDRYSALRGVPTHTQGREPASGRRVEMSYIGG